MVDKTKTHAPMDAMASMGFIEARREPCPKTRLQGVRNEDSEPKICGRQVTSHQKIPYSWPPGLVRIQPVRRFQKPEPG